MDTTGRRTLPKGVSLAFLPADWRTAIEAARASKDPKERRRAKHLWELGLAEQMRKLLRSSDLSVPGSRQHKVWTSYLHTETAWVERKSSWFARHPAHQDAKTYLDALEERYQTLLQTVLDEWDTNDFAEIVMKDGKATLDLSKDEKLVLPATVESLRSAILELMPHARLADVFLEVEDWTGFGDDFPHLGARQQTAKRDPRTDLALFAAILAHGLNLPLTTMAESTEIPYHEMTHASDWYIREENVRRAITRVVDYHHGLDLASAFCSA